jgi:hypothetical protein
MGLKEIKELVSQLSPADQAELRQYIDMLQSNETVLDPLPDQVWDEIERREEASKNGHVAHSPAADVISRLSSRLIQ